MKVKNGYMRNRPTLITYSIYLRAQTKNYKSKS